MTFTDRRKSRTERRRPPKAKFSFSKSRFLKLVERRSGFDRRKMAQPIPNQEGMWTT